MNQSNVNVETSELIEPYTLPFGETVYEAAPNTTIDFPSDDSERSLDLTIDRVKELMIALECEHFSLSGAAGDSAFPDPLTERENAILTDEFILLTQYDYPEHRWWCDSAQHRLTWLHPYGEMASWAKDVYEAIVQEYDLEPVLADAPKRQSAMDSPWGTDDRGVPFVLSRANHDAIVEATGGYDA